jgi:hypothetical protein
VLVGSLTVICIVNGSAERRAFPAHMEVLRITRLDGDVVKTPHIVPDPDDRWVFRQTADGQWYAHPTEEQ